LSAPPDSGAEVRSAEQKALIGLILGICQFPLMLFCSFAMLGCAIPALILGHQAHKVLRRPEVESGRTGMALTAKVLGIIGVALGGLLLLGSGAMYIWMFTQMQAVTGGPGGGGPTP
jgi:membrane protein DedA with SNARE-associated domain